MTRRIRKALPGVLLVPDIAGTTAALKSWRAQRNAAASSAPSAPR
jgi:hypothetical protein